MLMYPSLSFSYLPARSRHTDHRFQLHWVVFAALLGLYQSTVVNVEVHE